MIDKSARKPYCDRFKFDLFHEEFSKLLSATKNGENHRVMLQQFIEENYDFWIDYDPLVSDEIALILSHEVYELYKLYPEPDNYISLKPSSVIIDEPEKKQPKIRDLAKEFLASKTRPQKILTILKYVNEHIAKPTTRRNLQSTLSQLHGIVEHYTDYDTWGLCSMPYKSHASDEDLEVPAEIVKHDTVSYPAFDQQLKAESYEFRYSTKRDHTPTEFFTKALSNSCKLDLGLGYFSSACFNVLACGFAHFVKNGGVMRMYINPGITKDDYELLRNSDSAEFEKRLLSSYDDMFKIFSHRDELFFRCLAYLIRTNRIEIKIVVLKDGGIAHEKFGIFEDITGNKVAFNGSMNLTASGLVRNIEVIDTTCSWQGEDAAKRINCYQEDFNTIWEGFNSNIDIYPAEDFCNRIVASYPEDTIDELVRFEEKVVEEIKNEKLEVLSSEEPHFPSKFPGAFPYQIEAYRNWIDHGKKGIFAMATGTGKTITSLNCALEEYQIDGFYRLVILVPSLALVEQWGDEVKNFNFKNVILVSSENSSWKQTLVRLSTKLAYGRDANYVLISTYNSFTMPDFQLLLPRIAKGAILIADEAHNIGSQSVRQAFRTLPIERRIALSATPNRVYDEEGTKEIETFFNDTYPYTYSFTMQQAIKAERLMEYKYFPKLASLNDEEMEKYADITKQLLRMFDGSTNSFSDPEKAKWLLMIRKNILHKASDKMNVFRSILHEIGEEKLKYCFVYSAAGKRSRSTEDDDENIDSYILKEMQAVLKDTYPNVTCNSYTGEDNKAQRKVKLSAFASGQLDVLFAKNCLDEGVDVPRAEYGIFTSSTGNPRQFVQRRGRLIRKHPDKTFAYIYDIIVTPNFSSPFYEKRFWKMERSLVMGEMRRVANFAQMASNYYTGAMDALSEVLSFYEIDLNDMVLNENN